MLNEKTRSISLLLSLAICLAVLLAVAPAGAATTTIRLTASPAAIAADGRSVSAITAEVRDPSGNLVPDGTQVRFSASLGQIDTAVNTVAGVARAILKSGTQPGQAMISAVLPDGQAVSQTQVDFVAPGTRIENDAFISVESDSYVAYSVDMQTVDAAGGVQIGHRGLTVQAEEAQIDVGRNLLRAKGKTGGDPVRLSRGSKTIAADVVVYDLQTLRGLMLGPGADGSIEKQSVNTAELTAAPFDQPLEPSAFQFADLSDSSMIVKARSLTLRPRHDIQFRKAEMYMDGERIVKLPLYVLSLTANPSSSLQFVGVTSSGLRVNVPIYFALSPSGAAALRIRNQQGGWSRYSSLPGWALDLEQSYASGSSEGRFTVGQVNRSDWGLDWEHNQEIGTDTRLHSYFGYPAHRDLFGMVNLNKSLSSSSLGLNLRGQKNSGQSASVTSDLYLQTNPKELSDKVNYSVTVRSTLSNEKRYVTQTIGPNQTVVQTTDRYGLGAGLQLQLFSTPLSFGAKTTLTNSLSIGQDFGGLRSGLSMYGNAMLISSFSPRSSLALGYTYARDPGFLGPYGRHRLTASYMAYGDKWRSSLVSIYTLDQPITSAYATIGYQFRPSWRIDVRGTYQRFQGFSFTDAELALARQIGSQEVMLTWSQSLHKFRLELGAASF